MFVPKVGRNVSVVHQVEQGDLKSKTKYWTTTKNSVLERLTRCLPLATHCLLWNLLLLLLLLPLRVNLKTRGLYPTLSFIGDPWMGRLSVTALTKSIDNEIIHWKCNVFLVPSEINHLLQAFADGSALESIALKASFMLQILLLQKPSQKSTSRDRVAFLKRRLEFWKCGDIQSPFQEGRCIQRYLTTRSRPSDDGVIARNFGTMMEQGKVRNALQ